MPKRKTRVEQAEATRRLVLKAARAVFLARGFHDATLDEVAAEAGFTKGAVYSRFESKADLFLALLEERIAERIAQIRAATEAMGPEAAARASARQWAELLRTDLDWSLLVIEFRVHAARHPAVNARYAALHGRLRAAIAESVASSLERSRARATMSADDLARVSLALGTGMALERRAEGTAFPDELFEASAGVFMRGVMQEPAARTTSRRSR